MISERRAVKVMQGAERLQVVKALGVGGLAIFSLVEKNS